MNKLFLIRASLAAAIPVSALLLFSGCSSKPKNLAADCKASFDKYHAKFEKKKYSAAKDGYDEFVTSCAGTEFAEEAYFELGESHYALKDWMEAEQEYESFLKEYPSSKRFDETVHYKLAMSMSKQTQIPQRDQTKTIDAIHEFETYLAQYPESPRTDSAKLEVDRLRGLLADRDTRVAKLYSRMDEPLAAAIYYKHILKEYGDRVPRRELTLKLAECYIELEQFVEAENQLSQFDGVAKDDPFREKVRLVQRKLEKAQVRFAREKKEEKKEAEKKQAEQKSQPL